MNTDRKMRIFSSIAGAAFILIPIAIYVIKPILAFVQPLFANGLPMFILFGILGVLLIIGRSNKTSLRVLSAVSLLWTVKSAIELFNSYIFFGSNPGIQTPLVSIDFDGSIWNVPGMREVFVLEILYILSYLIMSLIFFASSLKLTEKNAGLLSAAVFIPPILYLVPSIVVPVVLGIPYFDIFTVILYPTAFLFSGFWIRNIINNKGDVSVES